MIHRALGRPIPIELTNDERVRGRVVRLALVSVAALGLIAALAATTTKAPGPILGALAVGWLLMPLVLAWSLREPGARYLLVVPSSLVSIGLLAICVGWPPSTIAAAGWLLMTGGVVLGAGIGLWFWFRLIPVPAALEDPLAPGRWALIALHVALVVLGGALAASAFAA